MIATLILASVISILNPDGTTVTREATAAEQAHIERLQSASAAAASNAAVQASLPQSAPTGIETPVLILATTNPEKGVGLVADPETLDIIVYLDHESPRDPAAIAARIAAEKAKRNLLRLDLRGVRTNLVAVIDLTNTNIVDCQAIKAATTNVTNAAQGKQISDLAGEAVDTNRRLKDLAQELQNLRAIVRDLLKGSD